MPVKLSLSFPDFGPSASVEAYYNPAKITVAKQVPWVRHEAMKEEIPVAEFSGTKARSMSLELFFDTYETGKCVFERYISRLEQGTRPRAHDGDRIDRPPTCLVQWGVRFPKFVGVITSLSVSYTMFFHDGTPCRATAAITLEEVNPTAIIKRILAKPAPTESRRDDPRESRKGRRSARAS